MLRLAIASLLLVSIVDLARATAPTNVGRVGTIAPAGASDEALRLHRSPWQHLGTLGLRLTTYALPDSLDADGRLRRLASTRTGVLGSGISGVRVEITLPDHLRFEEMEATVVDGFVLEPDRSVLRTVGRALLGIARWLLFGHLVASVDGLELPVSMWTLALGMPDPRTEALRLRTSERVRFVRGDEALSDHGDFVIGRSALVLTPWTEFVAIRVRTRDTRTGERIDFDLPHLVVPQDLHPPFTAPPTTSITAWLRLETQVR